VFAPPVAKAQTKAATSSTSKRVPTRTALTEQPSGVGAVEQAPMLQWSIDNQAMLRLPAQRATSLTGNEPHGRNGQETDPTRLPTPRATTPGVSWDFSKIPIFPPDRATCVQARPSLNAPPLPGVLQPKLAIGKVDDPLEREADRTADQVMRMPNPTTVLPPSLSQISVSGRAQSKCGWGGAAGKSSPCTALAKKEQSQLSAARGSEISYAPLIVHDVLRSSGQSLDPSTRAFMEPRFGCDFGRVRVHADTNAAESARSINASAYTVGQHIAFAAGGYAPSTTEGRKLLAHELAHTVQQNEGVRIAGGGAANREIVRRRVPDAANAAATLPAGGTDLAAHEAGLVRLLHSTWRELSPANQLKVRTDAATFGISAPTEAALFAALAAGTREQILKFADAIRAADPTVTLGDPALIDTGPRAGTADAANITKLVGGADKIFDAVATGSRDSDLSDIFGPPNIVRAKAKFARARTAMHSLQTANKIVTDRSGYNREVGLGGLTSPQQISLAPENIDRPTDTDSRATLVHESLHAGNTDVTDLGYIGSASFTEMTEADKLNNAADYEVVANRILTPAAASAFPGKKFVPAGASIGGVSAPPLTQKQTATREASETYRAAWTAGLNLHTLFVRVFKRPAEWNTLDLAPEFGVAAGTHFSDSFPFWSKVENMTIHKRPGINAAGSKLTSNPVTEIDVAQSESVIRKLSDGMSAATLTEPQATLLETKATPAQAAEIAKGSAEEAKVLVSLIRSERVGEITGPVERDERAVARLAKADRAAAFFDDVLSPKNPATFAD
jgi:hypothetical protein